MLWVYRKIEKIKWTENDPDRQDEKLTTKPGMGSYQQTNLCLFLHRPQRPQKVDLTPKPVKPTVRKTETKCELPKTVKTRSGRVVKPPEHFGCLK